MHQTKLLIFIVFITFITVVAHAQNTYNVSELKCRIDNDVDYCTTQNNMPVTGVVKEYHDGILISESNWNNGIKQGLEIRYDFDGNVKYEIYNMNNHRISKEYAKGNLLKQSVYMDLKNFFIQEYNPVTERPVEEKIYINDELYHTCVYHYSTSGNLELRECHKNEKEDGVVRTYYESGILQSERNIKDGKRDGFYKDYYETGTLHNEYNFKDGKKDGYKKSYDHSGVLIADEYYKNGQLIKQSLSNSDKTQILKIPSKVNE